MTVIPARSALDELDALLAVATPGPWDLGPNWTGGWAVARALIEDPDGSPVFHPSGWTADDAALIVALRNTAPAMLAAIRAAYALHVPVDRGTGPQCQGCATHVTFTPWPCPTVAALDEALGASGE